MKNTFGVKMVYNFYHSAVKAELKRRGLPKELAEKIDSTHATANSTTNSRRLSTMNAARRSINDFFIP